MMEYDKDGNPTGYWVRKRNYGQFRQDYDQFLSDLTEGFSALYGHYYITDEAGNVVNSATGEYAEDETWTYDMFGNPSPPIYYRWKQCENDWLSRHCHRRYTADYYNERMSVPFLPGVHDGHGLSPKTLSLYDKVQREVNYYLERCTHEDDGLAHVEDLTDDELDQLAMWQERMDELTNPFDRHGNPKSLDAQTVAYEIRAWQKWLNEHLDTRVDMAAWRDEVTKLAKAASDARASGDTDAIYKANRNILVFYKFNSIRAINPEFIDATIGRFDTIKDPESTEVTRARINIRALTNLTLTDSNTIEPQLKNVENDPNFFKYYKESQEEISANGNTSKHPDIIENGQVITYDDVFNSNFRYRSVLYRNANGQLVDVNGNPLNENQKNQAVTFFAYLKNKYINKIKTDGNLFYDKDGK